MDIENENFVLADFKELLEVFQKNLLEVIKEDPDYEGQADELLDTIQKLRLEIANVKDEKEFYETKFQELLPEITYVLTSVESIFGDEDEDFEDEEFDDEDYDQSYVEEDEEEEDEKEEDEKEEDEEEEDEEKPKK